MLSLLYGRALTSIHIVVTFIIKMHVLFNVIFFGSEHITSCSHPLYLSLQSTQGELAYRLGAKLLRWVSLLLDPLRVFQARILEWVAISFSKEG